MIVAIILLPISIIILNIWIWLFQNIFEFQKNKNKIIIITIIMGLISGLSIILYPKILGITNLQNLDFTNTNNVNSMNVYNMFFIYLLTIILLVKIIINKFKFSIFFGYNLLIFGIIYILFGYIGIKLNFETMLIYYIFVGAGEEFIKYFTGITFFEKHKLSNNDLLVFCILSAIGFAFIENLVYMIGGMTQSSLLEKLFGGTSILITRGIIGFLVHIIFTGNIGLAGLFGFIKNSFYKFICLGIIFGIILHYGYDVLLYKQINFIVVVFFILGYLWISYLFYISDRIYLKNGLQSY